MLDNLHLPPRSQRRFWYTKRQPCFLCDGIRQRSLLLATVYHTNTIDSVTLVRVDLARWKHVTEMATTIVATNLSTK